MRDRGEVVKTLLTLLNEIEGGRYLFKEQEIVIKLKDGSTAKLVILVQIRPALKLKIV